MWGREIYFFATAGTRPIRARRELSATIKPRKPKMTELGVTSGTGTTLAPEDKLMLAAMIEPAMKPGVMFTIALGASRVPKICDEFEPPLVLIVLEPV